MPQPGPVTSAISLGYYVLSALPNPFSSGIDHRAYIDRKTYVIALLRDISCVRRWKRYIFCVEIPASAGPHRVSIGTDPSIGRRNAVFTRARQVSQATAHAKRTKLPVSTSRAHRGMAIGGNREFEGTESTQG
jgi:hypothetical protein